MKTFIFLFLLFPALFFLSCNKSESYERIKVGMTYDEVESILDKPISITRGVNETYYDVSNIPYEELKTLNLDTIKIKLTSNRWAVPQKLRTIGNLIYVTWIYDRSQIDSFYTVINTFKEKKDTVHTKIPIFYIGNKKVSREEYNNCDGYEYRLHDNKIVDRSIYEAYKNSKLYKLPNPRKVDKRIQYVENSTINTSEIKDSIKKEYYLVKKKFCVIFDASSGRVTESGFFPFEIVKL